MKNTNIINTKAPQYVIDILNDFNKKHNIKYEFKKERDFYMKDYNCIYCHSKISDYDSSFEILGYDAICHECLEDGRSFYE